MIMGEPAVSWPLDRCQLLHCKAGTGQQAQQDSAAAKPQSESTTAARDSEAPGSGSSVNALQSSAAGHAGGRDGASAPSSDAATGPSSTNGTADSTIDIIAAARPSSSAGNSTARSGDAGGPGASNVNIAAAAGEAKLQDVT